jgi:hypothetical protein
MGRRAVGVGAAGAACAAAGGAAAAPAAAGAAALVAVWLVVALPAAPRVVAVGPLLRRAAGLGPPQRWAAALAALGLAALGLAARRRAGPAARLAAALVLAAAARALRRTLREELEEGPLPPSAAIAMADSDEEFDGDREGIFADALCDAWGGGVAELEEDTPVISPAERRAVLEWFGLAGRDAAKAAAAAALAGAPGRGQDVCPAPRCLRDSVALGQRCEVCFRGTAAAFFAARAARAGAPPLRAEWFARNIRGVVDACLADLRRKKESGGR